MLPFIQCVKIIDKHAPNSQPNFPSKGGLSSKNLAAIRQIQTEKEEPQPQVVVAFGLRITN